MINDRRNKWAPFNSCVSTNYMIKEIKFEKNKQPMPILSEDQTKVIEELIIDAYNLKEVIVIKYYYDGIFKNETGIIQKINKAKKMICLNNNCIYFKQIINALVI